MDSFRMGGMIALIQRVSEARVVVNGNVVGEIEKGILALIGVERHDSEAQADRLLERLLAYRIFPDEEGKMNLDLRQADARKAHGQLPDTPILYVTQLLGLALGLSPKELGIDALLPGNARLIPLHH